MMGGALSAPTVAGVLSGCTASTEASWTPSTLSTHQDEVVTLIAERIIPTTDTPGAQAARVNRFIDAVLTESWPDEEVEAFTNGVDTFDERAENDFGAGFLDLSEDDQTAFLTAVDEEAFGERADRDDDRSRFFRMMKELTVVGYYTSEIGATQELQTNLVPGHWSGCIPLSDVGRAWA